MMGASFEIGTFPPKCKVPDPIVNIVVYFKKAPALGVIRKAFQEQMLPLDRFSSRVERGNWVPLEKPLDDAYHFQEEQVADEAAGNLRVEALVMTELKKDHPLWQVIVLRAPAPHRSIALVRVHHIIGDGIGLLYAFAPTLCTQSGESVLATVPLPSIFLPPEIREEHEAKQRERSGGSTPGRAQEPRPGVVKSMCQRIWRFIQGAIVPLTMGYDAALKLNEPLERRKPLICSGNRSYIKIPPIDVGLIKKAGHFLGASVNDVVVGMMAGALRHYGAQTLKDDSLKDDFHWRTAPNFKALMTVALPRPVAQEDRSASLVNRFNFASLPLPISESDPAHRISKVKEAMIPLKSPAFVMGSWVAAQTVLKVMPSSLNQSTVAEIFGKHSVVCANVPGPTSQCTWPCKEGGEPIEEIYMIFPNVLPQVSMLTYNGKLFTSVSVDPELWLQADQLIAAWAAEVRKLEDLVKSMEDQSPTAMSPQSPSSPVK